MKILPTVRIKNEKKRKKPYRVYYRSNGKVVMLGDFSGKADAIKFQRSEQRRLTREYGDVTNAGYGAFSSHIPDFLAACKRRSLADDTIDFYAQKLGFLSRHIGGKPFASLDRFEVLDAIKSAGNSPTWEKGILRALSAYMNWGHSQRRPVCQPSFTKFIDLENPRERRHKNFFTVEEANILTDRCKGDWRRWPMALKRWAGIRTRELDRMDFNMIDFGNRVIHMFEEVSKTEGKVMTGLPPILWDWLEDAPRSGKICKGSSQDIVRNVKRYASMPEAKRATMRRTFATYGVNLFGAEKVRGWLRHDLRSVTMERSYVGCVTQREGEPYIADAEKARAYFRTAMTIE